MTSFSFTTPVSRVIEETTRSAHAMPSHLLTQQDDFATTHVLVSDRSAESPQSLARVVFFLHGG